MARIIFISPYLKGGKDAARLAHRTKYVATREGVELLKSDTAEMPPTKKQIEFIGRLVRSFPEAKELLEYEDYKTRPSRKSAGELIEQMWEQYVTAQDQRENFLDYVAHRPGVKSDGDHGLWDANGKVPILSKAVEEVASHQGIVWTPIVSLRREDAVRLGYDNVENWRALVNSVSSNLAKGYKIPLENLRWYAAMHEKEKHIHIHMVVFSKNPAEGYLTKDGIRSIKSAFASRVFKDELLHVYERKTEYRDTLQKSAEEQMKELIWRMENGTIQNKHLERLTAELASRLKNVSGKKVYGYLPPQVKRIVDQIVDEIAKDEKVAAAYSLWQDMQNEVCRTYTDTMPERLPLSRQKEFKTVRNMVIREALALSEQKTTFEDEAMPEEQEHPDEPSEYQPEPKWKPIVNPWATVRKAYDQSSRYRKAKHVLQDPNADKDEIKKAAEMLEALWNEGYKVAAYFLGKAYRDGIGLKMDEKKAEGWFLKLAEGGDEFAQYALGKLLLKQDRNTDAAIWLSWAADKGNQYAQYQMGKLYLSGDGVKKSTQDAVEQFSASADQNNQYAQYALGKLYLFGVEVPPDEKRAVEYLTKSAAQGNQYAQYLLDHRRDKSAASVGAAMLRMLHHMGGIFRENRVTDSTSRGLQIDKKRRRQLQEKRLAMGHKPDDHEEENIQIRL